MFYACVEDSQVISIVDYKPKVPGTVLVFEISEIEKNSIEAGDLVFDNQAMGFRAVGDAESTVIKDRNTANRTRMYLIDTDWMVLRHIREQALGIETTLSQEEYLQLELDRQRAAKAIK